MRRSRSYTYGYSSYRGRSRMRTILLVVIGVLLAVLIFAIAAFFLLQEHIYYGDDGKAHIDLPGFAGREEPDTSKDDLQNQDIVVITAEPTDEPADPILNPVQLPASALTDGTALAQVTAAGGNAALFDMKGVDGTLAYVSDLPEAIRFGASAAQTGLNEAIQALNETAGLYTIARVTCFRDNLAPRIDNTLAIRSPAGNWRDASGIRYLSPAVAEARDYLSGICGELAALGFDEIWLDCAGYPTSGTLSYISTGSRYDPNDLGPSVTTFYQQVADTLANYPGVKLSISAGAEVLTGEGDLSGQDLDALKLYADRLYIPGPTDEAESRSYDSALEALGLFPAGVVFTSPPYQPNPASSYAPTGGLLITP